MIKLHVDYNERELLKEGVQTIVVELDGKNSDVRQTDLREGAKVILSDGTMECEAILRHGKDYEWVADMIRGTSKDFPEE
jgi:hypothetical protein